MADKYVNTVYKEVVESSANTLTFSEIAIGMSLFDKKAMLIARIEWYAYQAKLIAASDAIEFGLATSNSWAVSQASEKSIITFHEEEVVDFGTAGNAVVKQQPMVDDYTTLPGGGILVAPKPLYLYVVGANLAASGKVQARIMFTFIDLKADEYLELLESRQFFG